MAKGMIFVGTSGWNYRHWKGNFYPEDLKQKEWLKFYSQRLGAVEINNSFYRLPDTKTFKSWAHVVPKKFIFAVKGSRYITHMKKLNDPEQSSKKLFAHIKYLKEKLGPILFQLPPNWKYSLKHFQKITDTLLNSGNSHGGMTTHSNYYRNTMLPFAFTSLPGP